MVGKVLDLCQEVLHEDSLATQIANHYMDWEMARQVKVAEWREVQEYIFATDTTKTTNSKLDWSNKTTIPKLCQIRDNLHANYMAALFPKRRWLTWEADNENDDEQNKKKNIESFMRWCTDQRQFYRVMSQFVYDFIDYGNVFGMSEWVDMTNRSDTKDQSGFNGPRPRRISPLDIVFNPTGPDFETAPKIIRSLVSLGEVKEMLLTSSKTEEDRATAESLYKYLSDVRHRVSQHKGEWTVKDRIYSISGFGSFWDYLKSDVVEVLTFYGSIYDRENDKLLKNVVIKIVDRHKIIYNEENDSAFGYPPIFNVGWRLRPDIIWAMGPLDNLVGMQYRIDHLENMKADCFDLIAYPPLKIKGYVEDFNWGPMERIYVGDEGDVEMMSPDVQVLNCNTEIAILEQKMEEMAGAPKEAMGFRTPGEKTKYEIQSIENASSRIFQSKIACFERDFVEPMLNGMLADAVANMSSSTIRVFNDEFKTNTFLNLTKHDITGSGRIKPYGARHFAEQTQLVQNVTNFLSSAAGQDPSISVHLSGIKLAKLLEAVLELDPYGIVSPYVRLEEQIQGEQMANAMQEQSMMQQATPTGFLPGDADNEESFSNEVPAGGLDEGPQIAGGPGL